MESKYGTFFAFGNHDKNYYGEEQNGRISTEAFKNALVENGVCVLEDEMIQISPEYTIIGRSDKVNLERESISALMKEADISSFIIDINHQPNDYDNESAAGVDLVLSGHTHGGQLWMIRNVGTWIKANDKTYGYEKRGNTNFIVTSGISDWAIDFKTGCRSEIVIISVVPESN